MAPSSASATRPRNTSSPNSKSARIRGSARRRDKIGRVAQFVVVSGLPGSGKSTLAQLLAPALGLPLVDKDTILERLFASRGAGDAAWRRALSRESDAIFQAEAAASSGAVLVSHWRLPGMPPDSGTPTGWLRELPGGVVHVHCVCPAEIAASRFVARARHPGHCDSAKSPAEIFESIRALESLGRLDAGPAVEVDTSRPLGVEDVLRRIRAISLSGT